MNVAVLAGLPSTEKRICNSMMRAATSGQRSMALYTTQHSSPNSTGTDALVFAAPRAHRGSAPCKIEISAAEFSSARRLASTSPTMAAREMLVKLIVSLGANCET